LLTYKERELQRQAEELLKSCSRNWEVTH